jgi:hypothetical protein
MATDPAQYFIYMIVQGDHDGNRAVVKIGIGFNPAARLAQLQIGNPEELQIRAEWKVRDRAYARMIERQVHKDLAYCRLRGEWFYVHPIGAMCTIDEYLGLVD